MKSLDPRAGLERLRGRLRTAVAPLQSRLSAALEGMSARDRTLLFGLVTVVSVVVLGLGAAALAHRLESLSQMVETRKGQLAMVQELAASYAENREKLEELQQKLEAHRGTTLSAFLDQSARKAEVSDNLKQVKPRSTTTTDQLEDQLYAVQLSRVTLSQLVDFLYEVETGGFPLLIRTMRVRPRKRGGETLLDVDLEISAFRIVEEEGS